MRKNKIISSFRSLFLSLVVLMIGLGFYDSEIDIENLAIVIAIYLPAIMYGFTLGLTFRQKDDENKID